MVSDPPILVALDVASAEDAVRLAKAVASHTGSLAGSDIAYDVHVRRVMLRTGLAERDEVNHMVDAARLANPERPGALDLPMWEMLREPAA